MSTLKCPECGHENETQRVYCHDCGARLDRSALIEEAQKPKEPVKPKRIGSLTTGFSGVVKNVLKAAFFGFLLACLIEAVRPPADAPSGERQMGADIIDAPSISVELEEAAETPRGRFGYSAAQLDAYLKNRVKAPKNPTIPASVLGYDSSYVKLQQGSFTITKNYLLFGLPVYIGGTYVPSKTATGLALKTLGGRAGSLPLPSVLYDQVDQFIFADYLKSLKQEAAAAGKMQTVEVTPKMVVITPR